jgi:hypothetical protein
MPRRTRDVRGGHSPHFRPPVDGIGDDKITNIMRDVRREIQERPRAERIRRVRIDDNESEATDGRHDTDRR